ncbi:hypothetical protein Tco_0937081 [Tanacetum coccineum]|uniref:Uncharacterized protein n=1 Tax=Tanacetum coccineum TaxID=301880 RepID=A0ABQ5DG27_9ASTR
MPPDVLLRESEIARVIRKKSEKAVMFEKLVSFGIPETMFNGVFSEHNNIVDVQYPGLLAVSYMSAPTHTNDILSMARPEYHSQVSIKVFVAIESAMVLDVLWFRFDYGECKYTHSQPYVLADVLSTGWRRLSK